MLTLYTGVCVCVYIYIYTHIDKQIELCGIERQLTWFWKEKLNT